MARNGKMQQVVTRVLAVMLVASLALAVVSFAWPRPVSAEYYEECTCVGCEYIGGGYCLYKHYIRVVQGTGSHCTNTICGAGTNYCDFDGCPY